MKKIIGIIIGIILVIFVGPVIVFLLVNFPFIMMSSETKITEEDKSMIEQYVVDTFGGDLELVRYDGYSNAAGTRKKFAIYKVNDREFNVGLNKSNGEWILYDTFESDYILGADENLRKQIPMQLQNAYADSRIGYSVTYGKEKTDEETVQNTHTRLNQYKKDIKNITREEILYRERDNLTVYYRAELSPESSMEEFENAIYELCKVMKSSGMGRIDINIQFGGENYRTGVFNFDEKSNYPVNSIEDIRQFYKKEDDGGI